MDRWRRSVLYVPASNERAVDKAQSLDCDVIIFDLEDAVAPEAKDMARAHAISTIRKGAFADRETVVRVNGLATDWGRADLDALRGLAGISVLAPKIDGAADVAEYATRLDHGIPLWAMIETARSLLRIDEIAGSFPNVLSALVLGTNDLAAETRAAGLQEGAGDFGALWLVVAAARAYGLSVLDGVYNDISDAQGFDARARRAAAAGFDGKTLIHPSQVNPCNAAFSPSSRDIETAIEILSAFDLPENKTKGAIRIRGKMVERLHLAAAHRIVAFAEKQRPGGTMAAKPEA